MLCHNECSYHSPRSIKLHLTSAGRALDTRPYACQFVRAVVRGQIFPFCDTVISKVRSITTRRFTPFCSRSFNRAIHIRCSHGFAGLTTTTPPCPVAGHAEPGDQADLTTTHAFVRNRLAEDFRSARVYCTCSGAPPPPESVPQSEGHSRRMQGPQDSCLCCANG